MGKVWEGEEGKACHPRLVPVWMVVQYREMYAYFFMLFLAFTSFDIATTLLMV